MSKKWLLFLLSLFFLTFTLRLMAQENLEQTVELGDGYVISLPEDWEEIEGDDEAGILFEGRIGRDDLSLQVLTPAEVADLVDVDEDTGPEDLMVALLEELYDAEDIELDTIELNYPTIIWSYEIDSREQGQSYLIQFEDGVFGFVDIYGEDFVDHIDTADAIVASFDFTGEKLDDIPVVSEPCFVSAKTAGTARLRVGPGENRTSVAFLVAGENFAPQGRIELDNGTVWFKLDKDKAAPGRAVNEIWVAETDIETDGNCEQIADASAPPIIPVAPRTGGGNTGGNNDGGSTEVGQVPNNGRWTLTLNPTTNASCTGTGNISFPTTDIFLQTSFTHNLTVSADKQSFNWGGDTFRILHPGAYNGSFDAGGGSNLQLRIDVQNPNYMTGWMTFNFTSRGVGCSATIYHTMARN